MNPAQRSIALLLKAARSDRIAETIGEAHAEEQNRLRAIYFALSANAYATLALVKATEEK